jgi:large repetitive protein
MIRTATIGTTATVFLLSTLLMTTMVVSSPIFKNMVISEASAATTNKKPVASATASPSTVNEGSSFILDGSNSRDSDGTIASYTWTQTAGPSVGPISPSKTVTVSAPQVNSDTTLKFTLTVKDDKGATATSSSVSVLVKNVNHAPTASSVSSTTTVNTPVRITVSGTDQDGDALGFYPVPLSTTTSMGGKLSGPIGYSTTSTMTTASFTYTPPTNFVGTDSFNYQAIDRYDAKSNPATVTITVGPGTPPPPTDTTAPDTQITGNSNNMQSGGTTPSTSLTISFTGSDNTGGSGLQGFECSVDQGAYAACTSPVQVTAQDGTHTFFVRAVDVAGNKDQSPATFTWTVDSTPPAAPTFTTPTTPAENSVTSQANPVPISGTTESGTQSVRVFDYGTPIGTVTVSAGSTTWTFGATLAEGQHSLTADAKDTADNFGPPSAARTFTVDRAAPTVPTITAPEAGTTTNAATIDVSGNAEDGSLVEVFSGTTSLGTTPIVTGGTWTLAGIPLAEGTQSLTAVSTDTATNTATSDAVSIIVDRTNPAAPVITSPTQGSSINQAGPVPISGTAESGTTVRVFEGATLLGTTTATGGGTWTITATLAEGQHIIRAEFTDTAGNTTPGPLTSFTVDRTAPTTTPTITSPAQGSFTNANPVTISGTTEAGTFAVRVFDGAPLLGSATPTGTGTTLTWTFSASGLAEGSHTIAARNADAAGNTGPVFTRTFTVDRTAPIMDTATLRTAEGTIVANGGTSTDDSGRVDFRFSARDANFDTFTCLLEGSGTTGSTQPGSFPTTVSTDNACVSIKSYVLSNNWYRITLTAFDKAGNTSTLTYIFRVNN